MDPVFQPGDIIKLTPCHEREIHHGDIIVCMPPGEARLVVHRVVEAGPYGIRTRGDRAPFPDPWLLRGEHIRGRVVSFERNGKTHAVRRGFAGRLQAAALRGAQRGDRFLSDILHPLYRRLSQKHIFRQLLPASMVPRVVTFVRPDGTDIQILMGQRVIGRCIEGAGWVIRRPYRLFVDERSLPDCTGRPCQSAKGD